MVEDVPSGEASWRRLAAKALKGRPFGDLNAVTEDGIAIEALRSAHPGIWLSGRGARPWQAVQRIDQADPESANRAALAGLNGGASALALVFADAPTAFFGGMTLDGLDRALDQVRLDACGIRIEAGSTARLVADAIDRIVRARRIDPALTDIAFGLDPAASSGLDIASLLATYVGAGYRGPLFCADGRVVHNAGAGSVTELAVALGSAVAGLRLWLAAGLPEETASTSLAISLAADQDQFVTLAKFRAIRLLWSRILAVAGLAPAPIRVHAETSFRMLTRLDPHANLVRGAIAAFAAATGGADSIAVLPFALPPTDEARRLALNTQSILADEANLHRVADPGAGSGAIEALTEDMAFAAWTLFQAIETEGGIEAAHRSGMIGARIAGERDRRHAALAAGQTAIVGTTIFRAASAPTAGADPAVVAPYPPVRTAAPFEDGA